MPLRAAQRTFLKILSRPDLIVKAWKSLNNEALESLRSQNPRHYLRITKRNINFKNASMASRAKIYSFHYSTIAKKFNKDFIRECNEKGVILWRSAVNPELNICLIQGNSQFRDGEIELQFRNGYKVMYFMGFTLVPSDSLFKGSKEGLLITRVQGTTEYLRFFKQHKTLLLDVALNHLLFAVMRGLAAFLQSPAIYGVSTKFQSYFSDDRFDRFNKVYDNFWDSLLGIRPTVAFYQLPSPWVDKDILDIKQHHRSRTKKKREFKNVIMESAHTALKMLNNQSTIR